ncbi:MAG: hypothetical protein O7I93_03360 [Gemmatimonadetes bacterium]|nr:hypothetical protein [Gemmatimonadota bacterium]
MPGSRSAGGAIDLGNQYAAQHVKELPANQDRALSRVIYVIR